MRSTIVLILITIFVAEAKGADITTFVVQEALRSDESGVSRNAETVTVGLPLPEDGGYTDVSSFGLTGSTVGQFKITGWWPNGNAQWVTVDLQTDLSADQVKTGFALTDSGNGNFGGANLAIDNGTTISVSTGTANFTLNKARFNLFDIVSIGSTDIVKTGNDGGIKLVDTSNVSYSSVNDADSTATIEENGPAKTVIVVDGSLKDTGNKRFCDYQARLTFYKNKSYVKGLVSLRNAQFSDYQNGKNFYSSELTVPITIGTTKTVLLTDATIEYTRSLGSSDTAYVYQGHSAHPLKIPMETSGGVDGWIPPIPHTGTNPWTLTPSFFGTEIVVGAETIQALGTESTWTQGYADLSDSNGKGLSVAMKYMPQYYPAGFDIRGNGDVSIELFSKRNNDEVLTLGWSKWESREVIWDFHDGTNDKTEAFHSLQHPLIARAPFEYYRVNKAFGTDKLVTTAEEAAYYSDESETPRGLTDPTFATNVTLTPWRGFFRAWARAMPGTPNTIDTPSADLLDWLRTGNAGFYVFASQRLFFDAYSGPRRSDGYTFSNDDSGATFKNGANISGNSFDLEHHYIQGLPWLYFLSGNSFYETAAKEDGEWLHRMYLYATDGATIPTTWYFRAWSRQAQPLSIYYDFHETTHDSKSVYADDLATSFTFLIDSREDTASIPAVGGTTLYRGRNMDRGYIYWDTTVSVDSNRVIWSFFHTQIHFQAAYDVWRSMNKWSYNYLRMEDFEDYLTGLSQFIYKEYITCEDVIWGGKCGFEYAYQAHSTKSEIIADGIAANEQIKPIAASRPYVWLHQKMGDDYQDKANKAATWSNQNERMGTDLQEQALYYQHVHGDIVPDVTIIPSVINNGDGSYTLSWTVPEGITKYQIKYADKPIVDWLGYDRDLKTYEYSPSAYTPFFAANNTTNEPIPTAAGSTQVYTITGLPSNGIYFTMKGQTITGTANYAIDDQTNTTVGAEGTIFSMEQIF